jgi:hypothetical protein
MMHELAESQHACREMKPGALVGIRSSMRKFEVEASLLDVEVPLLATYVSNQKKPKGKGKEREKT